MQFYSFEVVIEKEAEDEGYHAWSPSLPGCFSNGRTIEDAKRNMRTAVTQHVTALLACGEAIPQKRATGSRREAGDRHPMTQMPQVTARDLVRFLRGQGFEEPT